MDNILDNNIKALARRLPFGKEVEFSFYKDMLHKSLTWQSLSKRLNRMKIKHKVITKDGEKYFSINELGLKGIKNI